MHLNPRAFVRWPVAAGWLTGVLLLQACGGGGGGSPAAPPVVIPTTTLPYTKVCTSGDVVSTAGACPQTTLLGAANTWTCTLDNASGLMWLRDSATYTEGVAVPPAGTLCGRSGWRAPDAHELLSLAQPAKTTSPPIDTDYFPGTPAQAFVTAETYLPDPSRRWAVNFADGGGVTGFGTGALSVRWVAGSSSLSDPPPSKLVFGRSRLDHDVVDDTARGLAWLIPRNPQPRTYGEAEAGAAAFNASNLGYPNWRLPTRAELDTLVTRSLTGPAINSLFLRNSVPASFNNTFWTSTTLANTPTSVWAVDFSDGEIGPVSKDDAIGFGVIYVSRY